MDNCEQQRCLRTDASVFDGRYDNSSKAQKYRKLPFSAPTTENFGKSVLESFAGDIYSAGVCLYQIMTIGLQLEQNESLFDFDQKNGSLPSESLVDLIKTMMNPNP